MRLYYLEEKMSSMDWEYHGIPQGISFFVRSLWSLLGIWTELYDSYWLMFNI